MWEQMIYTSVDEVVDGHEVSGWHVKEASPGLTTEQIDLLLTFVRQALVSPTPLPRFPTREEIWGADRRLSQFRTPWGTALLHTAQAGVDATDRPNTVTHILLETSEDPAPIGHSIDFWRSPSWLTPFGHEAVKTTVLPPSGDIAPSTSVTFDTIEQFFAEQQHRNALGALVEMVARNLEMKAGAVRPPTILFPVSSSDEAAVWVAALSSLTSPYASRQLSWSTMERLQHQFDVDELPERGLDVAFVPQGDLEGKHLPESLIQVAPTSLPAPAQAHTSWGILASGALYSALGLRDAMEAVSDVMAELDDQRDLSPAWPLAMAEACDRGLLQPPGGPQERAALKNRVDRELLASESDAWERSAYLSEVVGAQFGSDAWPPMQWREVLSHAAGVKNVNVLLRSGAERYLRAAAADPQWLLAPRPHSEGVRVAVRAWSDLAGETLATEIVDESLRTLEASGVDFPLHFVIEGLNADSMKLPEAVWGRFLNEAVVVKRNHVRGLHPALVERGASPEVRRRVAEEVQRLVAQNVAVDPLFAEGLDLPLRIDGASLEWLSALEDLEEIPAVAAAVRLKEWRDRPGVSTKVALLRALSSLPFTYELDPEVAGALAFALVPSDFEALGHVEPGTKEEITTQYLKQKFRFPDGLEVASGYLAAHPPGSHMGVTSSKALVLARLIVAKESFSVTGTDVGGLVNEDDVRAAVVKVISNVKREETFGTEAVIACQELGLKVTARDLLAFGAGRMYPASTAEADQRKFHQDFMQILPPNAAEIMEPSGTGISSDFLATVRNLHLAHLARENPQATPPQQILEPGVAQPINPFVATLSQDHPFYGSEEIIKSVVRARYEHAEGRERDVLLGEMMASFGPNQPKEWLEEMLGLRQGRGFRFGLPWRGRRERDA